MDEELFELCKEVKQLFPDWYGDMFGWYYTDRFSKGSYERMHGTNGTSIPEYTSDYLLEKLPAKVDNTSLVLETNGTAWWAHYLDDNYVGGGKLYREADTLLKALLRLVIALKETGELV